MEHDKCPNCLTGELTLVDDSVWVCDNCDYQENTNDNDAYQDYKNEEINILKSNQ